jgi:Domain of unknown function (DUF3841)
MVIWSILTQQAWDDLQRRGRLRVSSRRVMQEFLGPYHWMADQMERRLRVPRPSKDAMPIWAWHQWEGVARRKPDLRAGGHLPRGVRGVRVECHVEDDRVLLSDFDLWHYVLNYWYLPKTEKDGEAFEKKLVRAGLSFYGCDHHRPLGHAQFHREVEQSWQRIFDVNWADRRHSIASPPKKKSIQATLWELSLADVVRTRAFTAR